MGNAATATATVASVDPSVPYFEEGYLDLFPAKATDGDALVFEVAVDDDYDALPALRVHWDLQPSKDTDGNDDAKDDPDRTGSNRPSRSTAWRSANRRHRV